MKGRNNTPFKVKFSLTKFLVTRNFRVIMHAYFSELIQIKVCLTEPIWNYKPMSKLKPQEWTKISYNKAMCSIFWRIYIFSNIMCANICQEFNIRCLLVVCLFVFGFNLSITHQMKTLFHQENAVIVIPWLNSLLRSWNWWEIVNVCSRRKWTMICL